MAIGECGFSRGNSAPASVQGFPQFAALLKPGFANFFRRRDRMERRTRLPQRSCQLSVICSQLSGKNRSTGQLEKRMRSRLNSESFREPGI
jgi:hypothetical protein